MSCVLGRLLRRHTGDGCRYAIGAQARISLSGIDRHLIGQHLGVVPGRPARWLAVGPRPLIAVHYVANGGVGLFVRGARGTRSGLVREYLFPHREFLATALARPDLRLRENFLLGFSLRTDMLDRANWPQAAAWFNRQSPVYEQALAELQRR